MELSELVQRIRRGDREALRELIAEYGAGVYRKAYQKTQDKDLAREATRRTFAQLVTTLQEQTDVDGWELWLNALTKRNIEACSNLRADMAYMEGELTRELFADAAPAARLSAGSSEQASVAAFWQDDGPLSIHEQEAARQMARQAEAERQAEAQRQAAAHYAAQQAAAQQAAQYAAQQAAAAQYAAQQQAAAQYAAQQEAAQQQSQKAQAPEKAQRASVRAQECRKKRAERLFDEVPVEKTAKPGAAAIVLLVLLCAVLAWMAVGVSMSLNLLPPLDLGYSWFNAHIAKFF